MGLCRPLALKAPVSLCWPRSHQCQKRHPRISAFRLYIHLRWRWCSSATDTTSSSEGGGNMRPPHTTPAKNRKTPTLTALGCLIVVTGEHVLVHAATPLSHMERRPSVEPLANRSPSGDHWRLQSPSWTADPVSGAGARRSWWRIRPRSASAVRVWRHSSTWKSQVCLLSRATSS